MAPSMAQAMHGQTGKRAMTLEGNILTPEGWFRGELTIRQGRIAGVSGTPVNPEDNDAPRIIPGFIDLHVHGGGGADLMEGGDALATLASTHARFGTTSLLGTSMTASREALIHAFGDAGRIMATPPERAADILGIHLEGPFINPDMLGAQPPYARPGTLEAFDELDALAPIRVITIAPEVDGHMALIKTLAARGVRVQIGHSAAMHDQCVEALQSGARGFTHLYNAMSGLHHRAPGVVGAALAHGDYAELIGDLVHVEAGALLAARRAIPHLYVVTDATAAAGMFDGEYRLGEHRVFKQGDSVRLADGGLAGSALTMDVALRNLTGLGLSLEEASQRLSLWPARYLGVNDRGILAPGYRADIVTLSPQLEIEQVWVAGQPVLE
ncbi:N-acetylglucosamine-6-phosphate deacetylase [Kushneria indalinina]|uniref:N-acetylglucosamine 6-phosphate deacetylase n=1 Tax=Kushneria indalinina DSM 14324 TaxID=1122140 RepID=A0A3D9DYM2_9GAMM|nr:N-acetylglucosamine-6-phosphate deacetylase [Kushneria indalinina]REC95868.1 N-acetylglucosamine 6-phosphate deacetylase [Kushneria indalinina DSM 14324]